MSELPVENPPRPKRWQFSLMTLLVVVLVASAVFGLIGRKVYWMRVEAARVNNLKMIGIAIHGYLDIWKCFPPAYIADSDGRPMHSWRVLLLPYMEHADLYKQYDFNEPWNGPNNSKLAGKMPDCYRCPTAARSANQTVYVAVVGERTIWPGASSHKPMEVFDGLANSILLVETVYEPVHWMEPRDAVYESTIARIRSEATAKGNVRDLANYQFLMSDGAVRKISGKEADPKLLEWLFIIDDDAGKGIVPPSRF